MSLPPPARVRPRRGLFACLVLVTALGALDQAIVATALPAMTQELGAPERASWIVTAYALALTAAMPAVGALGDRFGRRRMLTLSIVTFVAASTLCGLAGDVATLTIARLIQGLAGAGLLALPQAVVADAIPARDRAAYLGPLGAVFAVATVVSPLLGGWLTDAASWRWIFWINLPLGLVAVLLVMSAVPAIDGTATRRFDTAGAALLAATATGFVLITTVIAEHGWSVAAGAGAALTTLVAGVAIDRERRVSDPVLPVALLRERTVLLCCVLTLVAGLGLFGTLAYVPTWVQRVHETSASTAGLMLLPVTFGIILGTNGSGLAVRRTGRWRGFPIVGCALSGGAAVALAVLSGTTAPLPTLALTLGALGLGTGMFMQLIVVAAQDAAETRVVGAVTAGFAFVRELGVTAGAAVIGALVADAASRADTPAEYGSAFVPVFGTVAGCFAVGLLCALALPGHRLTKN